MMVAISSVPLFCQNKLCRNQFTTNEVVWPPQPFNKNKFTELKTCPKCGFKTGARIDKIRLGEIMDQAVIDHPELKDLKL